MAPIDLDVTRSIRAYLASDANAGEFSLDAMHRGFCEAAWYSPKDRRTLRTLCDRHPRELTRWLYARERDGRYTGLVMAWPTGHTTRIHDHAGLWGIEMVLQGSLRVDDFELVADARGDVQPVFVGSTVLEEGQSCAFLGSHGHAHRCTNLSSRLPAVTLHVYGGMLDRYRNFDDAGAGRYAARTTIAPIDGSIGAVFARSI